MGSSPEAELNLLTLTGRRWACPKTKLQNGSITTFVLFCGPGLLFLLALELKTKTCESPTVQVLQHTTEPRAVC